MTGKYTIQGKGDITIQQRDFVAKGGEKEIYAKGKTAYAIYHDSKRMIPAGKVKELSVLIDKRICGPRALLLKKGKPVGYTMPYLKGWPSLCELITKTYQQAHNITAEMILGRVKDLQELAIYVHSHTDCLIVDLNELNFLTDPKYREVRAIDVNAWQTPNYPADAILTAVRDPHAKGWTQETDWYSWGVVTFQMQIGAHPFKGGHPDYKSIPKKDGARMIARMKDNVSAFHAKATLPGCCSPLDIIPKGLRIWYEGVFEKGERCAPPLDYKTTIVMIPAPVISKVTGSHLFDIVEVEEVVNEILRVYNAFGTRVLVTQGSVVINKRPLNYANAAQMCIGFTPKFNKPYGMFLNDKERISLVELETGKIHKMQLAGEDLMAYDGRLYVRNGTSVLEVIFNEMGKTVVPTTKIVGQVLDVPEATKVFEGVVVQNLLGRHFLSVFPESGKCFQIAIPELDGYRVQDARYENQVFMAVAEKSGQYDRLVIRLDDNFQTHDVRVVEDVDLTGLNFTVSDAGVCVCLTEEDKIEVFSRKLSRPQVKIMEDPVVTSDMKLFHDGAEILASKGNKLHTITMRCLS